MLSESQTDIVSFISAQKELASKELDEASAADKYV